MSPSPKMCVCASHSLDRACVMNKQLCSTWNIALNRAECAVKTILWACNLVSPALTTTSEDDGSSKYGAKSKTLSCTGCCFLLPCKHCLYVTTKAHISLLELTTREALTISTALMCTPIIIFWFCKKPLCAPRRLSDGMNPIVPHWQLPLVNTWLSAADVRMLILAHSQTFTMAWDDVPHRELQTYQCLAGCAPKVGIRLHPWVVYQCN